MEQTYKCSYNLEAIQGCWVAGGTFRSSLLAQMTLLFSTLAEGAAEGCDYLMSRQAEFIILKSALSNFIELLLLQGAARSAATMMSRQAAI